MGLNKKINGELSITYYIIF